MILTRPTSIHYQGTWENEKSVIIHNFDIEEPEAASESAIHSDGEP